MRIDGRALRARLSAFALLPAVLCADRVFLLIAGNTLYILTLRRYDIHINKELDNSRWTV